MVITSEDLTLALGEILSKTSETEVKSVIGAYDQELGVKENIKLLCSKFQRVSLNDTCAFLKSISAEYPVCSTNLNSKSRTKEEYARDIITFLDFLKPTQCLVCNVNYVPTGEDYREEQAKCYICKRPSHGSCYDVFQVNAQIGVLFICSECLSVKAATELMENINQTQSEPQTPKPPHNDTASSTSKSVSVEEEEASDRAGKEGDAEDIDCPLYLKRMCPHGPSGKHIVTHPLSA